jgi:hypothetical protein
VAFNSLADRLATLPLVLAGPILRQVTESKVTVWLALKGKATVTLTVFNENNQHVMSGEAQTTPVGTALHVVAVTATVLPPFDTLRENVVYESASANTQGHFRSLRPVASCTRPCGVGADRSVLVFVAIMTLSRTHANVR